MSITRESLFRYTALFSAIMASGGNFIVPRELWVVLTIVSSLAILRNPLAMRPGRRKIYLWVGLVVLLLFFTQGPGDIVSIVSRLTTFIAAVLLLEVYLNRPADRFHEDLFKLLRLMSLQAILTWLLGTLVPGLFATVDVQGLDYHTFALLFNYHFYEENVRYVRPDGLFYEPGVFQAYLAIFLYLNLFWRFNLKWAMVAGVALITLWSTTGLLVALVLLLLASRDILAHYRGAVRFFLLAAGVVTVVALGWVASVNFIEKTTGDLQGSTIARAYDLYTGLNIIQERPLTGIGFGRDTYARYNVLYGAAESDLPFANAVERPNSNGIIQVLYTIGLPLGIPLLVGMFTQQLFRQRLAMAAILLGALLTESLVFTPFYLLILFSGFIVSRKLKLYLGRSPA